MVDVLRADPEVGIVKAVMVSMNLHSKLSIVLGILARIVRSRGIN